jgi:hypothetical protein|tara:strand:- start:51 stop:278 length:228 start_codon:yes stop_codon:yes gene_type:complete
MLNLIKKFFAPTKKEADSTFCLADKIVELQTKVYELEQENNKLYDLIVEMETSLRYQIDKIQPVIYNIHDGNKSK